LKQASSTCRKPLESGVGKTSELPPTGRSSGGLAQAPPVVQRCPDNQPGLVRGPAPPFKVILLVDRGAVRVVLLGCTRPHAACLTPSPTERA
jgi:hypothetical protein